MRTDRLLKLAEFLDTVEEDKFSLVTWDCGTTACAVGWACRMPEFQAEGLGIDFEEGYGLPTFHGYGGWQAVREFFQIDHETAALLFSEYSYDIYSPDEGDLVRDGSTTTARQVAERIRKLCA